MARNLSAALLRSNAGMTGMSSLAYPPSSLQGSRRKCCPCCIRWWSFHHPSPSPSRPYPRCHFCRRCRTSSYYSPPPPSSSTSSSSCWCNCQCLRCRTKWRQQPHHQKHTDNNTNQKHFTSPNRGDKMSRKINCLCFLGEIKCHAR